MEKFEYRIATSKDIKGFKKIHQKYHISSISEDDKKNGFVTTNFSDEQLESLINEPGVFICLEKNKIIGYVTSASWEYWSKWPMYAYMIKELPNLTFEKTITTKNSYQYGPVCIDKDYRGMGILENLFKLSLDEMKKKYSYVITFINKTNTRSYAMHTKKLKFQVMKEFEYNNNQYYELIYPIPKI